MFLQSSNKAEHLLEPSHGAQVHVRFSLCGMYFLGLQKNSTARSAEPHAKIAIDDTSRPDVETFKGSELAETAQGTVARRGANLVAGTPAVSPTFAGDYPCRQGQSTSSHELHHLGVDLLGNALSSTVSVASTGQRSLTLYAIGLIQPKKSTAYRSSLTWCRQSLRLYHEIGMNPHVRRVLGSTTFTSSAIW